MAITARDYLKFYSKDKDGRAKLRKLFAMARDEGEITEQENQALIKIHYILKNLDKMYTL